ncbi:hypothetical protein BH23ACT9_BH23ACT9_27430 [soil metagenome]
MIYGRIISGQLMDFGLATPREVAIELGRRARRVRLELDYTQQTLAERSGVSRPVVQRFEAGQPIGLDSLLAVLFGLGRVQDLEGVLEQPPAQTLDDALAELPRRQRGSR